MYFSRVLASYLTLPGTSHMMRIICKISRFLDTLYDIIFSYSVASLYQYNSCSMLMLLPKRKDLKRWHVSLLPLMFRFHFLRDLSGSVANLTDLVTSWLYCLRILFRVLIDTPSFDINETTFILQICIVCVEY